VYPSITSAINFINNDILKKLLKGLITNKNMMKIDIAEHKQSFLVTFVKIVKLKLSLVEFINIIIYLKFKNI
jgi:hypothetical protein